MEGMALKLNKRFKVLGVEVDIKASENSLHISDTRGLKHYIVWGVFNTPLEGKGNALSLVLSGLKISVLIPPRLSIMPNKN